MATSSDKPNSPTGRFGQFRFSLRGLMVFTFGAAVGSTALRVENARWFDGLLAAVLAWFVLGLLNQARDLWTAFHGRAELSPDERWGWRFAAAWRVAMAVILAGCYLVDHLVKQEYLVLPERWGEYAEVGELRPILLYLCLFVALKSTPRLAFKRRPPTLDSRLINAAGLVGAVIMGVILAVSFTLGHFMTHSSIEGIFCAFYPRFVAYGGSWVRPFQAARFFWWSLLAIAFALASLALVCQMNRNWSRGPRWRWILGIFFGFSASATACYVIWLTTTGLRELSPALDDAQTIGPLHRWFTALLLVTVLVTAISYRLVSSSGESGGGESFNWRRRQAAYYHENRAVALLLGTALMAKLGPFFAHHLTPVTRLLEIIEDSLFEPVTLISTAVMLVALKSAFAGWFRPPRIQVPRLTALPLAKFCAIWLALFIAVVVAIPTLTAFGFALWLSPWWLRWSWP